MSVRTARVATHVFSLWWADTREGSYQALSFLRNCQTGFQRGIPCSAAFKVTYHPRDCAGSPGSRLEVRVTTEPGGNDRQRTGQVSAGRVFISTTDGTYAPTVAPSFELRLRSSLPAASNAALPCPLPAVGEGEDVRKEGLPQPLRQVLTSTQKSAPQFPLSPPPRGRGRQMRSPFSDGDQVAPTHLQELTLGGELRMFLRC